MKLDRLPWIDVTPYDHILSSLISLCQKTDVSLISVQGPNGSGKSRILREVVSVLSEDDNVGAIAFNGHDGSILYSHGATLQISSIFKSQERRTRFSLALETVLEDKEHLYMLIDDVEALPDDIIGDIINILTESDFYDGRVTLVTFMGVAPIYLAARQLLKDAQMVTLPSMSIMQAKQFIDKVYHYTHQTKNLSMSEVNHLHSLSYGYAGRLIKLLEQYLINPQQVKSSAIWWIVGVVLSLPLIGVFLWFQYEVNDVVPHQEIVLEPRITSEPIPIRKEVIPVKVVQPIQEQIFVGPIFMVQKSSLIDSASIDVDEKPILSYVIELARDRSKEQLVRKLQGRSIPGKAQFIKIESQGSNIWVAYIGPYGSKAQAQQGKEKLPASLQSLPLKVRKEF
ncbi:SPOR domain-containing protein [Wohlfahrtiimonas larvae]|uniref:SPOR domain-containing protein n=1 Tax=Wohlfahrtiimonas larvae TaxID=1157986 RepID=A0ABP9MMI4_9GAMM|nr:SPOR domain-containing protein [Wohlfahrtiimonas larvae]